MNSIEKVKHLIKKNDHMTIATANESGKPWISPVFFAPDKNFNLYWVSSRNALHSQNVRVRPEVAIVIFGSVPPNGGLDGVYIDAIAKELEDEHEVHLAMAALLERPQPPKFTIRSIIDVIDNAIWRIYKAKPINISKRADDVEDGQAITVREMIKIEDLESK